MHNAYTEETCHRHNYFKNLLLKISEISAFPNNYRWAQEDSFLKADRWGASSGKVSAAGDPPNNNSNSTRFFTQNVSLRVLLSLGITHRFSTYFHLGKWGLILLFDKSLCFTAARKSHFLSHKWPCYLHHTFWIHPTI